MIQASFFWRSGIPNNCVGAICRKHVLQNLFCRRLFLRTNQNERTRAGNLGFADLNARRSPTCSPKPSVHEKRRGFAEARIVRPLPAKKSHAAGLFVSTRHVGSSKCTAAVAALESQWAQRFQKPVIQE